MFLLNRQLRAFKRIGNEYFRDYEFYDSTGQKLDTPNEEITRSLKITTISKEGMPRTTRLRPIWHWWPHNARLKPRG